MERQLYRILFLTSVFLLLMNDLYWKYEFHNTLTGKLSDFAGLFAFPFFFASIFPKAVKNIYYFTAILFIFWSSVISQPLFDFANNLGLGINRTVDNTDFVALIILPFSYLYWKSNSRKFIKPSLNFKPLILGICCFAFIATTLPRESGELNFKSDYEVQFDIPKDTVLRKIFRYYQSHNDPKYKMIIEIPEKSSKIYVTTIISELENNKTNIKLDSILYFETEARGLFFGVKNKNVDYVKSLKLEDFEKLFIEQKINIVRKE